MYIFNLFDDSFVKTAVIEELKANGVKYKPSKPRKGIVKNIDSGVFNVALAHLPTATVHLKEEKIKAEVPQFLFVAFTAIVKSIYVEGIFRKGGSACKQRELREQINSGLSLPDTCHVVDVCNLVKLFLRELPEPLIPHTYHETMLSCLLLSGEEEQRRALLLACLLLPRESITVLSYILEFLCDVAQNSASNKMNAKNLAIVITPSLMHIDEKSKLGMHFSLNHHISLVEMLIQSAANIGFVPSCITDAVNNRKGRKRSGSITKVFTGFKKIVRRNSTPPREACHVIATDLQRCGQKRKSQEILPPAVTVKRRREMADTTPRMCRMRGYSSGSLPASQDIAKAAPSYGTHIKASKDGQESGQSKNAVGRQTLKPSKSSSSLLGNKKKSLERKLSSITWRMRRSSVKTSLEPTLLEATEAAAAAEEVVTIPRKEYEEILTRVTCMEKILQIHSSTDADGACESEQLADKLEHDLQLGPAVDDATSKSPLLVQAIYPLAVDQPESAAPPMAKDRRRWSSENRVARSPSERKIGSMRRRSRELTRTGSKSSITMGRPNTQHTGLRNPHSNKHSGNDTCDIDWQPAVVVLASPAQLARLRDSPRKRDSINCLRRNNIGMVQAKAKFFDSLNYSTEAEADRSSSQSIESRLKSMQAEMREARHFRLPKEHRQPAIRAPLSVTSVLRTPRSCSRSVNRSRATPLKALPDTLTTPLRAVRRSPRILARTVSFRNKTSTP